MSKGLIAILAFASGAGAGFYAGKLYFDKKYREMYEKWHEEDLAYYDEKYGVSKDDFMNPPVEDTEEEVNYKEIINRFSEGKYEEVDVEKVDYTRYFDKKKEETNIDVEETPEEEEDDTPVNEDQEYVEEPPYTISPEDFATKMDYEKVTLTYFKGDKVFMDEDEEKIDDVLKLIGENNMQFVGQYEPGVLYVRNEQFETDYEVIFEECKYVEYLNGDVE